MTVERLRCGTGTRPPSPQALASKPDFEDGLASRSLDNSAYGQWRSAATLRNYSRHGSGYDLMTQHVRCCGGGCLTTHCGSPQATSRRTARLALTPHAVLSLGLLNSIVSDAAGGFVSVLIGLCDFATFFLCCLPSIGLVERCGEGDIGDAIALDRRKYRIDRRRPRDSGKRLRRNPRQGATVASLI
jgi:hypothetical protein